MCQNQKKVLFVHHGTGMGGAPQLLLRILQHIDTNKYVPIVWCIRRSSASELFEEHGISVIYDENVIPFLHISDGFYGFGRPHRVLKMLWGQIRSYHAATRIFKNIQPDIIHINSVVLPGVARAAYKYGCPVIVNILECLHPGYCGLRSYLLKKLTKKYARFFVFMLPSEMTRWQMNGKENSVAVFDFIDRDKFIYPDQAAENLRKKYSVPDTVPLIGYFGRFTPAKGVHLLIRALGKVKRNGHSFHALLVGPIDDAGGSQGIQGKIKKILGRPRYSDLLRDLIEQEGLAENVTFTGSMQRVDTAVPQCDILTVPFMEPHFSRLCAEAAAAGKPAIAFDIDGPGEEIIDGKTGCLATPFSVDSLAEKIEIPVKYPELCKTMGTAAAKHAEDVFDLHKNVEKVMRLYSLIKENGERNE